MLEVLSCQYCEGIDNVISIAGHDSPCGVLHRSQFFAENMQKYRFKDLESCGVNKTLYFKNIFKIYPMW